MVDRRIGYCCKLLTTEQFDTRKAANEWLEAHNGKSTTVHNLDKLSYSDAVEKVRSIIAHNQQALMRQFRVIATWPQALRMVRIGSEQLPVRTFDRYKRIYDEPVIIAQQQGWQQVGDLARELDLRLSSHPGPYTLLTSDSVDVVNRAIEDLEYHAEIFRMMGYDGSDQRQEINIHGGPKRSDMVDRFRHAFKRLAADTQQWLSVENDEFSYCVDDLLPLADTVKICVDINHYWIHQGMHMQPDDARIPRIVASWRGARPEMHIAWPAEEYLTSHAPDALPDMQLLEAAGHKKTRLRAHSDYAWIPAVTDHALAFWDSFDLCVEAKQKNLASQQVYNRACELGLT
jgi:UV DNA damage endonuclease